MVYKIAWNYVSRISTIVYTWSGMFFFSPDQTRHQYSLLFISNVHDVGSFKTFLNPVSLLQIVDKHALNANVIAIDVLIWINMSQFIVDITTEIIMTLEGI